MIRRVLWLPMIALAISACFSGYSSDEPPRGQARVHRGRFVNDLTLTGELEAARGGIYPAARAAELNPIEALRYE